MIKVLVTTLILSAMLIQGVLHAEDSEEFAVKPNRGLNAVQHRQLDTLFDALRHSDNEVEALSHEREIWRIWTAPTDEALSEMMDEAIDNIQQENYKASLTQLDTIIERFPKYAEAWNQRAVAHFQLDNFEASLSDIEATLKLEPRHFGALSGRGMIHFERGNKELAEKAILRAMRYHPYIRSRSLLTDIPVKKASNQTYI